MVFSSLLHAFTLIVFLPHSNPQTFYTHLCIIFYEGLFPAAAVVANFLILAALLGVYPMPQGVLIGGKQTKRKT